MSEPAEPNSAAQAPILSTAILPAPDLLAAIEEFGRVLVQARADIAALQADAIQGHSIPATCDELDAIAAHTEAATNEILDACEAIEQLTKGQQGALPTELQAAATRIFQACGFHDLVSQRITKVLRTLQMLDTKMGLILARLGRPASAGGEPAAGAPGVGLMNGPQLPQVAMAQSEIDRLLAGG